ncbi:MAG: phosphatidylserine decarboxylase [Rickettsiales bacterium]|jgi:phosphatidylserine decarboxylase|nr:phosphatidylserine decarboxylase [Rickettsiales bacterium]
MTKKENGCCNEDSKRATWKYYWLKRNGGKKCCDEDSGGVLWNDLKNALKRVLVPINPDGYLIIVIAVVFALLACLISSFLGYIAIILTGFVVYFFRDPDRVSPCCGANDSCGGLVLASADGIVDKIEETELPSEVSEDNTKYRRVSIFLNTFNVHVQRVPVSGKILKTEYVEGKFLNITNDKYHNDNERQICLMESEQGLKVAFVQIAGLVARRIVFRLKEGQEVTAGERFGSIKFGSRVDVYLPLNIEVVVREGQTMIGGETVVGIIKKD